MGTWAGANQKRPRSSTWASGGRKKVRRHRKKITPYTAASGALTMTFIVLALTVQGVMFGIAAGLSAAGTAIAWQLELRGWPPVPTQPDPRPATPKPRSGGGSGPSSGSGGTRPGKPRKRVCSARCRASTKPKSTCNCSCNGSTHGVGAAKP